MSICSPTSHPGPDSIQSQGVSTSHGGREDLEHHGAAVSQLLCRRDTDLRSTLLKPFLILPIEVGHAQSRGQAGAWELGRSVTGSGVTVVHLDPAGLGPRQQPPFLIQSPCWSPQEMGPSVHLLLITAGLCLGLSVPPCLLKPGCSSSLPLSLPVLDSQRSHVLPLKLDFPYPSPHDLAMLQTVCSLLCLSSSGLTPLPLDTDGMEPRERGAFTLTHTQTHS